MIDSVTYTGPHAIRRVRAVGSLHTVTRVKVELLCSVPNSCPIPRATDRWKLFHRNAAPFGALKIKSPGSLGGNSAGCSGAAIANARPLFCRFGPDLSGLRVRQGAQPTCVGHRVPVSVVVEVDEDAKMLSVPLPDAVGPPVQIGFAVRAGVEVIMVRAVEPHVNRCRGGQQDTGQAGATHHHIGCVVPAQQLEDGIDGPAVVAELDGDTHPFR